jgi:hypothetical protein
MRKIYFLIFFSLTFFILYGFYVTANSKALPMNSFADYPDSVFLKQKLYNGRIWRNNYSHRVTGNQFLFTKGFLPGSVTMNGTLFQHLQLRYDTYDDELLIIADSMTILQLNKEMVCNFTLIYDNKPHLFVKLETDSLSRENRYFEALYKGNTSLYVRHISDIERLAHGGMYDEFINSRQIYISGNGRLHLIKSKSAFFDLLSDKRQELGSFININRIKVSVKIPESFIQVLRYYETLHE